MGTNSATSATGINNKAVSGPVGASGVIIGNNTGIIDDGNGQQQSQSNQQQQNQQQQQQQQTPQYTIPGILHFIQHEWSRFEIERSQWDVDRAELQARIAMLLGERKGQENVKSDLIRRIKMLEYALKQERIKFHRLKFGCDPPQINDLKPPIDDTGISDVGAQDSEVPYSSVSNTTWRQGRQMLRQYLQEIGYTEAIIDVRSNRVRSLLGMNNNAAEQEENLNPNINGNENNKRASESQGRRTPAKKSQLSDSMILDSTEEAVMANFEFLGQDVEMSDDDEVSDDLDMGVANDEADNLKTTKRKGKDIIIGDDVDAEAEELLNDLNQLTEGFPDSARRSNLITNNQDDEIVDSSLGLGDLAQLTVNNDADENNTTTGATKDGSVYRKTWNVKYTLRSHFDGVRALAFHPEEPVLITASEDHTLKLWNLQKTVQAKKSASLDVEPLYTFRAHSGPVLCLAMHGETCYSGGLDGQINCWKLPNSNIDAYDCYDPSVLKLTLEGHTDAVWGLAVNHTKGNLVSCSADGTVKLWSPNVKVPLLNTFKTILESEEEAIPTSVDFVRDELDRIVVAYPQNCVIYDTETGKQIQILEQKETVGGGTATNKYINKVVSHPTLPITVTAHEDRHIRFWDNTTGQLIHSMVAHLESVTSLAIDSKGLYLLSGSHDCSIRLWHFDNKTCVQEVTAHRKKFDESIFDVAFHPTRPFIASAGADGLAKVFV